MKQIRSFIGMDVDLVSAATLVASTGDLSRF
jgi:hypothetical protein